MQKWLYYPDMIGNNPVCVDAGEITRILPGPTGAEYIEADGILFWVETKWTLFRACCFCWFTPNQSSSGEPIKAYAELPHEPKMLHELPMVGVRGYQRVGGSVRLTPVCIDPRVMYILDKGFALTIDRNFKDPPPNALTEYLADIPSMEKAIEYLKAKDFQVNNCLHPDLAQARMSRTYELTINGRW